MRRKAFLTVSTMWTLLAWVPNTPALVINVPGDEPDIASGINLADNGDTVLVAAGTYTGDGNRGLSFFGKDISVIGAGGSAGTTIDLEHADFGFIFNNNEPSTALLQGFTITNADSFQGANAIDITNNASLTIRDVRVTNNRTTLSGPFGIVRVQDGLPYFENCLIDKNGSEEADGIVVVTGGTPVFYNCLMKLNNTVTACVYLLGGDLRLSRCSVSYNNVNNGIYSGSELEMDTCTVANNTDDGIRIITNFDAIIDSTVVIANGGRGVIIEGNNTVIQNSEVKSNLGGGIQHQSVTTSGSVPYIANTVISGNLNLNGPGGGIFMDCSNVPTSDFSPIYDHCTITGNSSAFEGGGVAVCGAALYVDISPEFYNCTIAANRAGGVGGGIYSGVDAIGFKGLVTMNQTILWGNCSNTQGSEIFADLGNAIEISCSDLDSAGVAGQGETQWGPSTLFMDPIFCEQPSCDPMGTTLGNFELGAESPVDSGVAPCQQRVGANGSCAPPVSAGDGASTSDGTEFLANYPNPFNPVTTIRFVLARRGHVELGVYDVRGRLVRRLIDREIIAREHAILWRGRNDAGNTVSAGVYFAVLRTAGETRTRKMVLLK